MKKLLILSSALLALSVSVLLLQCSTKGPDSIMSKPKVSRPSTPQPQAVCNCGPKPLGCSGIECVDKLLGGQSSKTFTVEWKSCVTPDPSNTYCNGYGVTGTYSSVKLCYLPGSCTQIIAIISNPPSCLPCLPDPYCTTLNIECHGANDFDLLGNNTYPNNGNITVSITSDPKISVTCGALGNNYNCYGNLQ
jgi:hypothetical protein